MAISDEEKLALERFVFENFSACTRCNRPFREGENACRGFSATREPAHVCEGCSHLLEELVGKTYYMPRPYVVPEDSASLWRYMDFTKYVSLLASRALYFARVDQFTDPFEGAKGVKERKSDWDAFYLSFFREAVRTVPGRESEFSEEELDRESARLLQDLAESGEAMRKRTFVSCWHENAVESEAMWRLYSSFLPNAVAIRTTYGRLYRALGRNPQIRIGRVSYVDLGRQFAGVNSAFWRKRLSFEHEREVRAVVQSSGKSSLGKLMPCDLSELIESVHVSTESPGWLRPLIDDVSAKYGLNVSASQSTLVGEPFF